MSVSGSEKIRWEPSEMRSLLDETTNSNHQVRRLVSDHGNYDLTPAIRPPSAIGAYCRAPIHADHLEPPRPHPSGSLTIMELCFQIPSPGGTPFAAEFLNEKNRKRQSKHHRLTVAV